MKIYNKGNVAKGEDNPQAKLTWEKVKEIRDLALAGKRTRELARSYNVSPQAISAIINHKTWKEEVD